MSEIIKHIFLALKRVDSERSQIMKEIYSEIELTPKKPFQKESRRDKYDRLLSTDMRRNKNK